MGQVWAIQNSEPTLNTRQVSENQYTQLVIFLHYYIYSLVSLLVGLVSWFQNSVGTVQRSHILFLVSIDEFYVGVLNGWVLVGNK